LKQQLVLVCATLLQNKPKPAETFAIDKGSLKIDGLCVAGRRGVPNPYGPLQLWSKPLKGNAAAVLLANRGQDPGAVSIEVFQLRAALCAACWS